MRRAGLSASAELLVIKIYILRTGASYPSTKSQCHQRVGTNFGVGVGEVRPKGPTAGGGVPGEGTVSTSHQLGGLRERCKLPSAGSGGGAPAAEWFSCILSHQIAFPSISIRVAYSLHG